MTRSRTLVGLVSIGIVMIAGAAFAAEGKTMAWRHSSSDLPFPRSERAQSIWASDRCWKECGAYCAWGMASCLQQDSQGLCLKLTDKCDRYCQRECRTMGGPFLPIELPWD